MSDGLAELDGFLRLTSERSGSDLLLTVGAPPLARVGGELTRLPQQPPLEADQLGCIIEGLLGPERTDAFRREREHDFSFTWGETRVRANAYSQRGQPALALRLVPERVPSTDELGIPPAVRSMALRNQGLVLVTGPTGSGKSTTLAALIGLINQHRACHIITIEDPIEYVHRHGRAAVDQREIGTDSLSFERALRAALREDPDVVLVGEMRDTESISIALTIAETGHLVLSTLHTNDTAQAVDRVVDVFPAERQEQIRVQLAGSLAGVVAQRLVPRADGRGMVAAFEVLVANHAVRNLIREGKTSQIRNAVLVGLGQGMQTLEQSLSTMVANGWVGYDDAVARAVQPDQVEAPSTPLKVPTRPA